jgi:hypothetical protein
MYGSVRVVETPVEPLPIGLGVGPDDTDPAATKGGDQGGGFSAGIGRQNRGGRARGNRKAGPSCKCISLCCPRQSTSIVG